MVTDAGFFMGAWVEYCMRIGVAALQGAVTEHIEALERAASAMGIDLEAVPVRDAATFASLDGLVLPGGESTTISKLLVRFGLVGPIQRRVRDEDFPILGTCAGMVLLASHGDDQVVRTETRLLGLMDMAVDRNAFGRQRESFEGTVRFESGFLAVGGAGGALEVPAVFIRAPVATRLGDDARPIAFFDGRIVGVQQGRRIALAFHPELTMDHRVHAAFLRLVEQGPVAELEPRRS